MMTDINKLLGYSIARFGYGNIPMLGHTDIDLKVVDNWRKLTTEYFAMDEDHEDIEALHNIYKNYTAAQMRNYIDTLK